MLSHSKRFALLSTAWVLFCVTLFALGVVGYIMNIGKLIAISGGEITAMFLIRLIGLLPPIGAVMGWF